MSSLPSLTRNPRVRVTDVEVLSSAWYVLRRTTFDYQHRDGRWTTEQRERRTTAATAPRSCSTTRRGRRCC
ncbi:hypothetical protein [Amycolatopsis sp. NPDC051061]|uniref:hypothetical protein n=1 Tax=Amycolatopsis sp. NPDC051061 TaxID=3155042 RepID=UPI00342DD925